MSSYLFPGIHITRYEYECPCCESLPPQIYDDINYHNFFLMWENLREELGQPIKISRGGGWRCPKYQYSLIKAGKTRATCSPHSFFALDNDFDTAAECVRFVEAVKRLYPEMRIGHRQYLAAGKTFVHIDICYLVKPRPAQTWVEGFEW